MNTIKPGEKLYTTPVRLKVPLMDQFDHLRIEVRRRHDRNLIRAGVIREALDATFSPEASLNLAETATAADMGLMIRERLRAGAAKPKRNMQGKKADAARDARNPRSYR